MPGPLYLDTARLGLMSPAARTVYREFVEFVGEAGLDLYAEDLLRRGMAALPAAFRRRFPALCSWQGVDGLRDELRRLVSLPSDAPVLVAGRSTLLLRLALDLQFRLCRNVFTADVAWPSYAKELLDHAVPSRGRVSILPLREALFEERLSAADVAVLASQEAVAAGCDGLFLPMVTHEGVRLPVEEIARRVARRTELRYVVVDGAQAFCHVPVDLSGGWCDLFLTGCHKWPGAYHPLGLGFCGRRRHLSALRVRLIGETHEDPLLSLLTGFETGRRSRSGETVNVGPLFSCQGALADARATIGNGSDPRSANAALLAETVRQAGWQVKAAHESLRTAIVLAAPPTRPSSDIDPDAARRTLLRNGVAATAYMDGTVRLSAPRTPLAGRDLSRLRRALRAAG